MIPEIQRILRKNFKPGDDAVYLTVKVDGEEHCRIYEDKKIAEILIGTEDDFLNKGLYIYLKSEGYTVNFPVAD